MFNLKTTATIYLVWKNVKIFVTLIMVGCHYQIQNSSFKELVIKQLPGKLLIIQIAKINKARNYLVSLWTQIPSFCFPWVHLWVLRKWILRNVFFSQINSVYSFSGCLSNLQLNGASITSASQTFSVTPCFEGPMETGTYFSTEGGYVVLGNNDLC